MTEKKQRGRPRKHPKDWGRFHIFMPKWYYDIVEIELDHIRVRGALPENRVSEEQVKRKA